MAGERAGQGSGKGGGFEGGFRLLLLRSVPSCASHFLTCKTHLLNQAMDGSMNLEQALEERLRIINCTPKDIKAFIKVGGCGGRG
jgi:hypothetical protein